MTSRYANGHRIRSRPVARGRHRTCRGQEMGVARSLISWGFNQAKLARTKDEGESTKNADWTKSIEIEHDFCIYLCPKRVPFGTPNGKKNHHGIGQDSKPPHLWHPKKVDLGWLAGGVPSSPLIGNWWDLNFMSEDHPGKATYTAHHCTVMKYSHEISWCLLGSRCTIAAQSFEILYIKIWPAKCDKFSPAKERPGFLRGDGLK